MIHHHQPVATAPARVIILGGSGFVGRHLATHLLDQGIPQVPLSSADLDLTQPGSADRLAGLIQPSDALVFTSAITSDRGKDIRTLMRNLAMGETVCAALGTTPCAHVVYISSDAVTGDDVNPVHEAAPCDPPSFHGMMHRVRERMLADAVKARGIPLLCLRLSLLYGPDDPHRSYGPNRFIHSARTDGTITLFGQGEEQRDHVFIDDVSRVIGLALHHRTAGTLNIATGHSISFHEVAQIVAGCMDRPVEIVCKPRASAITHRHFDVAQLIRSYPGFRMTPPAEGIPQSIGATEAVEQPGHRAA
jgi:nucleoside-diphosphate-sugar epimerase